MVLFLEKYVLPVLKPKTLNNRLRSLVLLFFVLFQILKLYKRFIKAESFRNALVYQKKYLLLLQGGFQDSKSTTLAMIFRWVCVPRTQTVSTGEGIKRFLTVARVVVAVQRMKFLVNKSKRVSIAVSCESTSRSYVVNGDVSSHTVYQSPTSTFFSTVEQRCYSCCANTKLVLEWWCCYIR